ncbi:MAG: hypothetical protein M1834_002566 [Cirrosporium novae-zelandiae]|nr:MAG: hypothetical protein M1834_002566 [Cirrosporium novae-zelandiae]
MAEETSPSSTSVNMKNEEGMSNDPVEDPSIETATKTDAFVPPDRGYKAWLCVLAGFLMQFGTFGYVNACGIFQYYYQDVLLKDQSTSSLAWITTLQIFLLFCFGPIIGKLVDVYGPRPITIPFSVLAVFALCMLSLCKEYYQVMLAQGVAFGLGTAGISLPAMVVVSQWFSKKRGLAVGIVASGSSGVVFPIMVTKLIARVGFHASVRWTALLVGICLLIANICISSPLPHNKQARQAPKPKAPKNDFKASKSIPWIAFTSGCFFCMWGLFAPLNYLPEMAVLKGMSTELAQYTISIANAGSIFGRILPGHFADHVGTFNVYFVFCFLTGASVMAFWLPLELYPSNAGIIVFACFYGFVSGAFVSLGPPCVVQLADGKVERLGVMMGGWCLAVAFGSLTGLPIQGAIKDHDGDSFIGLMIFAGVVMLFGAVLIGVVRTVKAEWKIGVKV